MKAIGVYEGLPIEHPNSLVEVQLPDPIPRGHDLLVRVKSVSVNPVDYKTRLRTAKSEKPTILGWDAAGVVEGVGNEASFFQPGDEVFYAGDITRPGCNSELHLVDERIVGKKPKSLSFDEAAAMPLTTITAWESLFDRLGIELSLESNQEKSILIIGGAGGVGSIAIQLAKQVAGMGVIATASRQQSEEWCRKMGVDDVINHHRSFNSEFEKKRLRDVDYILCCNSTEKHLQNMVDVIKPQGKICSIIRTENNQPLDMNLLVQKSLTFAWELMYTRSMFQTPDMQEQQYLLNDASALFNNETLKSTLTKTFDSFTPETLKQAHALVEAGDMIGKVVLGGVGGKS